MEEYPRDRPYPRDKSYPRDKPHPRDRPYPRDKSYPTDKPHTRDKSSPVHTSARLGSRHKEKSDTRHQAERDGNHVESTEDGRSRMKLPLSPKAGKLEQLHQNGGNRSVKSQVRICYS